jgi:hypothetical protein
MYSTRSSLPSLFAFLALSFGCSAPFNEAENTAADGGAPDDTAPVTASQAGSAPDKNAPTPGTGAAGSAGAPAQNRADGSATTANSDPLPLDTPAPRVLQTSPSEGAVAVSPQTRILLRFSQPMDEATTEAAISFAGPSEVTWSASWEESDTLLSLAPTQPLDSAYVTLQGDQALEIASPTYTLTLGESAVDVHGQHVGAFSLHFQTPRQVKHTLPAVEKLSGVLRGDSGRYYGFLTYDLGELAGRGRRISSVTLHGGQQSLDASVPVYAVNFSELSAAALSAPGELIATVPAGTPGDVALPPVTFGLFDGRDATYLSQGRYAQVRLVLPKDIASDDWTEGATKALRASSLEVEYLLP